MRETNFDKITTKELERELKRRKSELLKLSIPRRKSEVDLSHVYAMCQRMIDHYAFDNTTRMNWAKQPFMHSDQPVYIVEELMKALYGDSVWSWIRHRRNTIRDWTVK